MEREMQEMRALLEYLVKHNGDHAAELKDLAARLQVMKKPEAYDHLEKGIELMNRSNESLQAALTALEA